MLHTKFHSHRSMSSGEEDISKLLPYIGMVAILVMCPGQFEHIFVYTKPEGYI